MKKVETNSIGYRIRQARERARISQEEFAKMLDVSKRTLIGWEKNERNPKDAMLQLIADATATGVESLKKTTATNNSGKEDEEMWKDKYILQMELNQKLQTEISELKDCLLKKAPLPTKKLS